MEEEKKEGMLKARGPWTAGRPKRVNAAAEEEEEADTSGVD